MEMLGLIFLILLIPAVIYAGVTSASFDKPNEEQSIPPEEGVIHQKVKEYGGSSSSVNVYDGMGGGSSTTHYYYKFIIHDDIGEIQDILRVSEFDFYKFSEGERIEYRRVKKGITNVWLKQNKGEQE